ncbi:Cell shape-determining protein MreC [Eubacterium plexicaudatum ASF492]|nr:Cell shape-determining protein MreC [Eubacterium plexicaudatum ASF492]
MFASFLFDVSFTPLNTAAGYVFIPMQKGINEVGVWLNHVTDNLAQLRDVMHKNEELQAQVDELTTQLSTYQMEQYDIEDMRKLLDLDEQYKYEKIGASIIGKDAGNWFDTFIIDKGSEDGIEVDMNVIAGSGLVGIITNVGPNYANVRSIIDDRNSVSAMVLTTSDKCFVNGDLEMMSEQQVIAFTDLTDADDKAAIGDQVVTSYTSSKYLPGLLIGQIHELQTDSNNLTKSGTITPAVDFEHIKNVLVILDKKQAVQEKEN